MFPECSNSQDSYTSNKYIESLSKSDLDQLFLLRFIVIAFLKIFRLRRKKLRDH